MKRRHIKTYHTSVKKFVMDVKRFSTDDDNKKYHKVLS